MISNWLLRRSGLPQMGSADSGSTWGQRFLLGWTGGGRSGGLGPGPSGRFRLFCSGLWTIVSGQWCGLLLIGHRWLRLFLLLVVVVVLVGWGRGGPPPRLPPAVLPAPGPAGPGLLLVLVLVFGDLGGRGHVQFVVTVVVGLGVRAVDRVDKVADELSLVKDGVVGAQEVVTQAVHAQVK